MAVSSPELNLPLIDFNNVLYPEERKKRKINKKQDEAKIESLKVAFRYLSASPQILSKRHL